MYPGEMPVLTSKNNYQVNEERVPLYSIEHGRSDFATYKLILLLLVISSLGWNRICYQIALLLVFFSLVLFFACFFLGVFFLITVYALSAGAQAWRAKRKK